MTEDEVWSSVQKSAQLIELGRYDSALSILEKLPLSNTCEEAIYHNRSICYIQLEQYDKLKNMLDIALKSYPNSSSLLNHLAYYYRCTEKYSKAQEIIDKAIEQYPMDESNFVEAGLINVQRGKFDKSNEYLIIAEQIAPDALQVIHARAIYYYTKNDKEATMETVSRGLKLFPNNVTLLSIRTNLMIGGDKSKRKEAEEAAIDALRKDPTNEFAKENLLEILKHKNFIFRIFVGNAFNRYKIDWNPLRIFLFIIAWKGVILWGGFAILYLLINWYGGVWFNSFIRMHTKYKLLLSKSNIIQSNIFLVLNGIVLLLNFMAPYFIEVSNGILAFNAVLFSIMLITISFFEIYSKAGKIKFFVFCAVATVITAYWGRSPFSLTLISTFFLLLYSFLFSVRVAFK